MTIVDETVARLANRDPLRTEADLQGDIAMLLLAAGLNLASIFHDWPVWGWSASVASRLF